MTISESLHPFAVPTLVVVTDNVQAKIYRAEGRSIELVHSISTKLEQVDQDRVAISTGAGMRSGEQHEDNQKWTREQLYVQLNKDLMHRMQNGEFEELAFTVPHEHINELKEALHTDLAKRTTSWVPKNLANEDLLDVVAQIEKTK